jgi:hypothetical protein
MMALSPKWARPRHRSHGAAGASARPVENLTLALRSVRRGSVSGGRGSSRATSPANNRCIRGSAGASPSPWPRPPRGLALPVASASPWPRHPRGLGIPVASASPWPRHPRGLGIPVASAWMMDTTSRNLGEGCLPAGFALHTAQETCRTLTTRSSRMAHHSSEHA